MEGSWPAYTDMQRVALGAVNGCGQATLRAGASVPLATWRQLMVARRRTAQPREGLPVATLASRFG